MEAKKPQVINCHTHLFTSESVPPKLSRKMLPWPLSWILTVPLVINVFKFWYKNRRLSPLHFKYKPWYKSIKKYIFNLRSIWWGNAIFNLVKYYFIGHVFLILLHSTLLDFLQGRSLFNHRLDAVYFSLIKNKILFADIFGLIKWLFLGTMFLLSQDIRRFLFNLVKWSGQVARLIPDTENLKYLKRYLNIGRYAIHDKQSTIFTHLEGQYEVGTGFVVLPMDMAYMGAGDVSEEGKYHNQMSALLDLKKKHKDTIFPFVFIDPRRIRAEKETFLNIKYNSTTAKVELHDCFVKKYIEDEKFNGFKIYPALGYYPFDEDLLLLWKYAIDKGLPIMSHVIRGTIFYRGNKAKEWNFHPVFTEADGDHNPLPLYERSNGKFSANFTHPLNFLCLLNERLLRKIVSQSNEEVKSAFGFTDLKTKLTSDLSQLKICFGHYGGDDEWKRYLNADRDNYAHSIVKNPTHGIDFLKNQNGDYTETKLEYVWRYVDWYSIVTSLLLQYPNTYADISYILNNEAIYPLLKSTLTNPRLRNKVLFGTDFYVVRNHKTEKQLLAEVRMYIGLEDFEQIGVVNPGEYLRSVNYGEVL